MTLVWTQQIKSFVILKWHEVVVEDSLVTLWRSCCLSLWFIFSPSKSALIALRHTNSNTGSSKSLGSTIPCFWEYPEVDTRKKGKNKPSIHKHFFFLPSTSQQVTVVCSCHLAHFTPFTNLALGAFNKCHQATMLCKQAGTRLLTENKALC